MVPAEYLGSAAELTNVRHVDWVKKHVKESWAYGASLFAAAAYVLDPEFRTHDQNDKEEVLAWPTGNTPIYTTALAPPKRWPVLMQVMKGYMDTTEKS